MENSPQLIGGPSDGIFLPVRYANAPVIQVPIADEQWNFATYAKDPKDSSRFLFQGFTP